MTTKELISGESLAYMYTVEWEKTSLPHIHTLVWLKDEIKPDQIDSVISAEVSNPNVDQIMLTLKIVILKSLLNSPYIQRK